MTLTQPDLAQNIIALAAA